MIYNNSNLYSKRKFINLKVLIFGLVYDLGSFCVVLGFEGFKGEYEIGFKGY
jgi:hypothetical protein